MSDVINNSPAPAGIINAAPNAGTPTQPMSDPVLQAAEEKLEAGLTDTNRAAYDKIVVAGMAAALTHGPNGLLAKLVNNPDPVQAAAKGAFGLVLLLQQQAKGVMPYKAMIPAATTLLLRALDFVNRVGKVKVGTPELVRATHILTDEIFHYFKITPGMLIAAKQRVTAMTQDPRAAQLINAKAAGMQSNHPMAQPTNAPAPVPNAVPPPGSGGQP